MSRGSESSRRLVLLLVLPLLGFAGCIGPEDGGKEPSVPTYEQALADSGLALGVVGSSDIEVQLLDPGPEVDSPGTQRVLLLVHDASARAPVTDAEVSLEARMPAMGHGTGPETDPVHVGEGIYEGQTTWSMAGEWVLHLDVELPEGSSASFTAEVSVGEHDRAPSQEPVEAYGSFGDVMAAPGTVYEGELASPARENLTVRDELQEPTYERRESLELQDRPLVSLAIRGELDPGTDLAELNVTLLDPGGSPRASLELTAEEPAGEAVIEAPSPGEWQLNLTGRALDASYEVVLEATYEAPHVDVKTLDPADPTRTPPGERGFLFAVFDAHASSPVEDAPVNASSQTSGGQDRQRLDPVGVGHGQYRASPDFSEGTDWLVEIEVHLPTGEAYRYEVDVHVEGR